MAVFTILVLQLIVVWRLMRKYPTPSIFDDPGSISRPIFERLSGVNVLRIISFQLMGILLALGVIIDQLRHSSPG
jgi:hypothetical protein